jgi:hypothetical protein
MLPFMKYMYEMPLIINNLLTIHVVHVGGATGYEESLSRLQPRIATKAQIFEKAEGSEVTLKCDPQVN